MQNAIQNYDKSPKYTSPGNYLKGLAQFPNNFANFGESLSLL